MNQSTCPLCDQPIDHKPIGEHADPTHAYLCTGDACPFVGIEYYNQQNIDDLHAYLSYK